jgi:putative ABC transport system ATP-binding protein
VTELSVGQQQRVAAARALIGRPPILVADEPTSSLDADIQADFLRLLMSECANHATTLLFVSHDLTMAPQFDRTIEIRDINRVAPPSD